MMILLVLLLPLHGATNCPQVFARNQEPTVSSDVASSHDQVLCNQEYAVYHSGARLTPVWSAEHLTDEAVAKAHDLQRVNDFREDERIPSQYRSWLTDFRGSGLDRGHCAPNGDFDNPQAASESFLLSNMIPQNRDLNRGLWERIEVATRFLAKESGDAYIVTGPLFEETANPPHAGRVPVPSHIWKLIYLPSRNAAAAYLCRNEAVDNYQELTVAELQRRSGIDFHLGKVTVLDLPRPTRAKAKKWR